MTIKALRGLLFCALALQLTACAPSQPDVPYPAFVRVEEIPDVFIAGLPGVRAKGLVGANSDSAGGGYRIDLPSSWQGTSGASPDKTLEIFVIDGELSVADVSLKRGGYAYLPPGTLGFKLKSSTGARILYFLDDIEPTAVIRTPLILESGLIDWDDTETEGVAVKELRADPGSGARSWLVRGAGSSVSSPAQRSRGSHRLPTARVTWLLVITRTASVSVPRSRRMSIFPVATFTVRHIRSTVGRTPSRRRRLSGSSAS
jgi:hypothetical protein